MSLLRPDRHFSIPYDRSSMATSTHNARIELALADLASQDKLNYIVNSKKYGVARMTLRDRFTGQSLVVTSGCQSLSLTVSFLSAG